MSSYEIRCVCGETLTIDAPSQTQAIKRLLSAMEGHWAGADHPEVPKDLSSDLKTAMVKARMRRT